MSNVTLVRMRWSCAAPGTGAPSDDSIIYASRRVTHGKNHRLAYRFRPHRSRRRASICLLRAYNIAATDPHSDLTQWLLRTTQERSIRAHAKSEDVVLPSDSSALLSGYRAYVDMCVVCHGAPGEDRGWMGQGLNPEPPDLTRAAERLTAEEVYWVLRNGIKLAGMPALSSTHSDEEILELTSFVEHLPTMSAAEYQEWGRRLDQPDAPHADDGHDHTH